MNPKILAGVVVIAAALMSVRDIRAGDFVWTGEAGTTAWRDAGNWKPSDRFPGAEDVVRIEGGEVTVEVAEEVGILELHGGTLGGGGTLTIRENLVWAGEARLTGMGRTILGEEAVGWVESPQAMVDGAVFEIRGHLGFSGSGYVRLTNAATAEIAPGGSVDLSGNQGGWFRGNGRIVNRGLLQKTSEGSAYWGRSPLINDGILSVRRGVLMMESAVESDGGVFHVGRDARLSCLVWRLSSTRFRDSAFIGEGETILMGEPAGAHELQGNILSDRLILSNAPVTGSCRLLGTVRALTGGIWDRANLAVVGRLEIVGDRRAARLRMVNGSRVEVMPGGVLSVEGALDWTFSGTNAMEVIHRGEFSTGTTGEPITVSHVPTVGSTNPVPRWINHGIVRHREGQLSFQGVGFSTTGRMEVRGGSVSFEGRNAPVELGGETFITAEASVEAAQVVTVPEVGARVEGEGWLEIRSPGALVANGPLAVGRLRCSGGWLEGEGGVFVESELDFRGSYPTTRIPRPRGAQLIVGPQAVAQMGSSTLILLSIVNHGTLNPGRDEGLPGGRWVLDFRGGNTIRNYGVIHLKPGTQWVNKSGGVPSSVVVNHGRILRTDGDGEAVFVNLPLVNHGRIEVDRGWLSLLGPVQLEPSGTFRLGVDADADGYRGPRLVFGRPLALAGGVELVGGTEWDSDPGHRRTVLRAPEVSGILNPVAVVPGVTGANLRLAYRSDGVDVVEGVDGMEGSTGLAVFRDGGIRLGVESVPGREYRLEVSSDLRSWIPWATNRVPVVDPEDPQRFFRIAPDP